MRAYVEKRGINHIVTEVIGIKGVAVIPHRRHTRAPEACCRFTIPGYTRIVTVHNGNNFLLGERRAWTTHICHRARLETCEQHVEDNVFVYIVRSDDLVHRVNVVKSTMSTPGMEYPIFGLWQIVAFHRPGVRNEMFLPRLLLPLQEIRPIEKRWLH